MRRQQIYLIKSKNLHRYNLADITFNENVVLIIYDQFTPDLYKYIFLNNIFLIPVSLFNSYKSYIVTIEGNAIYSQGNILKNDCTLNDVSYLPSDILDNSKLDAYQEWFDSKVNISYSDFEELIPHLSSIPVTNTNYDNIVARVDRMRDFGQPEMASKLMNLFTANVDKFLSVQTLSIQAHDFKTSKLEIKVKLDDRVFVYDPFGYHSYIDTLTKYYFYNGGDDLSFIKLLAAHPIPVVFFGILNYNLSHNINRKTNKHRRIYKLLLAKLNEIQTSQNHTR